MAALVTVNGKATGIKASDLIEPMLVTIPNVEICEVGEEWQLSTGPLTLTPEHIASAAEAWANDPAVKSPRLKFGHTSDWGDAEPAFGRYENLRVENNGMTLVADLVGVPSWFKDIAAAAFPNRSMEAYTDATTHTGKTHKLIINAVSFLGVVMPGINTLEDLAAVWAAEPPEGTQILAGNAIYATRGGAMPATPIAAAVGTDDLRKEFYNEFASGDRYWWWIRQTFLDPTLLIVDDDEGGLWAVEYTVTADAVTFSEPIEIITQYVYKETGQVAASGDTPASPKYTYVPVYVAKGKVNASGTPTFIVGPDHKAEATYASAGESRPQDRKKRSANAMELTVEQVRDLRGLTADDLPDDADDAAIMEALKADPTPAPEPVVPEPEPVAAAGKEGDEDELTTRVDKGTLSDMQTRLAAHDKRAAENEKARRAGVIDAAVGEGRIARARKSAWAAAYERDPEGTEKMLTASEKDGGLPKGLVPVTEIGVTGADVSASTADDDVQQAYYAQHFPELAAQSN